MKYDNSRAIEDFLLLDDELDGVDDRQQKSAHTDVAACLLKRRFHPCVESSGKIYLSS